MIDSGTLFVNKEPFAIHERRREEAVKDEPPSWLALTFLYNHTASGKRSFSFRALRGIEWVQLLFPDVKMLARVNVNVPEKVWSYALKAK